MTAPIHVFSSNFAWLPVISADGRFLASDAYKAFYVFDPAAQGKDGPFLFDLQAGTAHALPQPQGMVTNLGTSVLGLDADGSTAVFSASYSGADGMLVGGTYVGETNGTAAAPVITDVNKLLGMSASSGTLAEDGVHVVVIGDRFNPGAADNVHGVYEIDLRSGAVTTVKAVPSAFNDGLTNVNSLRVSADGGVVLFGTTLYDAKTLASHDEFQAWNVATGSMTLANASTDGTLANDLSTSASLSGNGRYVAFASFADNLTADSGSREVHGGVYVKDLATGAIRAASADASGNEDHFATLDLINQAISNDGRYVVFESTSSYGFKQLDVPPPAGHISVTHAFVKDMQTGAVALVNAAPETIGLEAHGVGISGDGKTIVFQGIEWGDFVSTPNQFHTWAVPLPTFTPLATNDVVKGAAGADTLAAGLGDDTYYVNNGKDIVVEYPNAGTDTVHAQVSYTLPDNVENLVLDGTASIDAAGNALANTLQGNAGANRIAGGAGDDLIAGGGGVDTIDGGAGFDTVRFGGKVASYQITGGEHPVVQLRAGADKATLTSVELLKFDDATVTFDTAGANGQVYRLYQAAFDRTPDTAGMGYWMRQAQQGASMKGIADGFVASAEFKTVFGADPTHKHLVDGLYQHILHRAPDAGGEAYWLDLLDRNVINTTDVLLGFSESAENVAALTGVLHNGIAYVPYGA